MCDRERERGRERERVRGKEVIIEERVRREGGGDKEREGGDAFEDVRSDVAFRVASLDDFPVRKS